tara:strand:+ start:42322 stop:42948 length:627 start_codon:yes stop_codon:yes gene_type:complete
MIDFDISSNIHEIPEYLDEIKSKIVLQAARTAINKTLISARKVSISRVGLTYKLKPSGLSKAEVKKKMFIIKARGGSLKSLEGKILYKGEPIPIIKFVSGSKNIIKMKGIKVKKRRIIKAEIKPGRKIILKKAFIQRAKTTQVFKGNSKGFKKQAVASISIIIMRRLHTRPLLKHVAIKFNERFINQLNFRLNKHNKKMTMKRLKELR